MLTFVDKIYNNKFAKLIVKQTERQLDGYFD